MTRNESAGWWGAVDFASGQYWLLQCADLQLHLRAESNQWMIDYDWPEQGNWKKPELRSISTVNDPDRKRQNEQRYVFATLPDEMTIQPAMSDRPVVCRPEISVNLLPLQEMTLFVCLPLWLQVRVKSSEVALLDIPTVRVSESWFGPNTREGIFSYASKTNEQLDIHPSTSDGVRVVVEVRIQNQASTMLTLDKVSVPAPNLGLYSDKDGNFYTPRITLIRRENTDAMLSVDKVMSCGLNRSNLQRVCKPREDIGHSKITKAITALFG